MDINCLLNVITGEAICKTKNTECKLDDQKRSVFGETHLANGLLAVYSIKDHRLAMKLLTRGMQCVAECELFRGDNRDKVISICEEREIQSQYNIHVVENPYYAGFKVVFEGGFVSPCILPVFRIIVKDDKTTELIDVTTESLRASRTGLEASIQVTEKNKQGIITTMHSNKEKIVKMQMKHENGKRVVKYL